LCVYMGIGFHAITACRIYIFQPSDLI
jgi:hypothetical protein